MPAVLDEYVTHRPVGALRGPVAAVSGWAQDGGPATEHRGLPSPWLTVIITLHDPLVVVRHPDPAQPPGSFDALVGGLHTTPALVAHGGRQSGMQLAVHPLAARPLLGVPAGELAGRDEHAADVVGPWLEQLQDRVRGARGWSERFATVEAELGRRLAGAGGPEPELLRAWTLVCREGRSVAEVAADVGWSARRLHDRFRAEIGLGPQDLRRVARFDRARRAVAGGCAVATVAADLGYTDQAHLTREFSRFAGLPPRRWLAAEGRSVQDRGADEAAGSVA